MAAEMDETKEINLNLAPPGSENEETPKRGAEPGLDPDDSTGSGEVSDFDKAPPGLEPPVELLASIRTKSELAPEEEEADFPGSPEAPDSDEAAPMPEVPQFSRELSAEERIALKRVLMAMLFASTEALSVGRLSEAAGLSVAPVKELLQELREDSLSPEAVFELKKHGDGWRLYTKEEFYPYLVRLRSLKKVERLTPAALETLAIIAYRQPVIRAEIEAIRGVKVGPMLRALLDRKLISIVGRANVPGAPFQYGTTKTFLERFGLESLKDLPSLKEFQQGRI